MSCSFFNLVHLRHKVWINIIRENSKHTLIWPEWTVFWRHDLQHLVGSHKALTSVLRPGENPSSSLTWHVSGESISYQTPAALPKPIQLQPLCIHHVMAISVLTVGINLVGKTSVFMEWNLSYLASWQYLMNADICYSYNAGRSCPRS